MHVRVRKSSMKKTQVHADDVNLDEISSPPNKDVIDDNSVDAFKKVDKYWFIPKTSEKMQKVGEVLKAFVFVNRNLERRIHVLNVVAY